MTTRDKGITLSAQYANVNIASTTGLLVTDTSNDYTVQNAWRYAPAKIEPINYLPLTLVGPASFSIRSQDGTPSFAASGGNINLKPGVGSVGNVSGNVIIADTAGASGWNAGHLIFGSYHIWVDASSRVRVKFGAPTVDTDGNAIGLDLSASAVFDPPNLIAGAGTTTTIAVAGAALGDLVIASFSLDLQSLTVNAYVSAANIVSVRFQNGTAGAIDILSGTLRVKVIKQ